jgi:YHS domain-containing protein
MTERSNNSFTNMKKYLMTGLLALTMVGAIAADKKEEKKADNKYPLDTCVVSGEKLDSMGKPYVIKYKGREVQLCCDGCEKDFKKDPAKYLKKLDDAEKKSGKKADKAK